MLYFLKILDKVPEVCSHPSLLQTIKFLYYFVKVMAILIPILLVISSIIKAFQSLISDNKESLNKLLNSIGNKILIAIIFFLIPNIIFSINGIINSKSSLLECLDLSLSIDMKEYKKEYDDAHKILLDTGPATGGTKDELVKMIKLFEGGIYCEGTNKTKYKVVNVGDGKRTIGPGLTENASVSSEYKKILENMEYGDCYDVELIDKIFYESAVGKYYDMVISYMKSYNITWPEYKIHALTSLCYNAPLWAKNAIKNYAKGGEKALAKYIKGTVGTKYCGWAKRRDQELELFFTGVYPTDGYSRKKLKYFGKNDSTNFLKSCGLKWNTAL